MSTDITTASIVSIYSQPLKGDVEAMRMGEASDASLWQVSTDTGQSRLIQRISMASESVLDLMAGQYGLLALIRWNTASIARKRELLSRVIGLYGKSGTIRGLRAIFNMFGQTVSFDESGDVYTYTAHVAIGQDGMTADDYLATLQLLAEYTPARAHLTDLTFSVVVPEVPKESGDLKAITFLQLGA